MRAAARRLRLLPAAPARWRGWPLPWVGQHRAVFPRVRSSCDRAADRKPRGPCVGIRFTCTTIRYSINDSARRGTDFVDREVVLKENLLVFLPPAPETDSNIRANLNI